MEWKVKKLKTVTQDKIEDFYNKIEFESISSVEEIVKDVRANGDDAVKKYVKNFDNQDLAELFVTEDEIKDAYKKVDKETIEALKLSIKNVKKFAKAQLSSLKNLKIKIEDNELGHNIIPLERVGCYIPGGNYPLLSSAVMTIVPAKVAGVNEVYAFSPKIRPETIVACDMSGADKIFKFGGVQAISAMAYGTQSVGKVNKIVGPGNKYVTSAKKYVYGEVGIDFLAGPSEVMIIADETARADYVAADILAQCEHDVDARSFLVCESEAFAIKVQEFAEKFLKDLPTRIIAEKSFEKSFAIIVKNIEEAIELANKRAPEHLELCFKNAEKFKNRFINYGSLFIGNYSAEVFGDYCSGTNHVLPTNQVSKYSGGLSVFNVITVQTYQKVSKKGNCKILPTASKLADKEGLMTHKLASDIRKFT